MQRRNLLIGAPLAAAGAALAYPAQARRGGKGGGTTHMARLSGANEVPPSGSSASGMAKISVDPRGHKATIEVVVQNLDNVVASHFHLAPAGENGPIVVTLYGPTAGAGRESGVLYCRTVTKADLQGLLAGMEFSALLDEIDAGNIYVNVHTAAIPSGEIRGQVQRTGRGPRSGHGGGGGHDGGGDDGGHHH